MYPAAPVSLAVSVIPLNTVFYASVASEASTQRTHFCLVSVHATSALESVAPDTHTGGSVSAKVVRSFWVSISSHRNPIERKCPEDRPTRGHRTRGRPLCALFVPLSPAGFLPAVTPEGSNQAFSPATNRCWPTTRHKRGADAPETPHDMICSNHLSS